MPKFTLNMYEIMNILDPINQNAYDKLQSALEHKICKTMYTKEWLDIWDTGEWNIEMSITFEEANHAFICQICKLV